MPLFKVSGWYDITKYVDRIVEAEDERDARHKAWSEDYIDEIEHNGEGIGEFEVSDVEEIG